MWGDGFLPQVQLANVLLEGILEAQLRRLNRVRWRGQERPFSDGALREAVAKLRGGWLEVRGATGEPAEVKRLLDSWDRARAEEQFRARLRRWEAYLTHHGLPAPRLRLWLMGKRWGSCTPGGTILLNPALVRAPGPCVDYVAHEVRHLRFAYHGPEFYAELAQIYPPWQSAKARLERAEL